MIEEALIKIAELAPVVTVLCVIIYSLLKRETKLEDKIVSLEEQKEELNKELRDSDKENVSLLI